MLQQLKRYSAHKKLNGFFRERFVGPDKKQLPIGVILDLDIVEKAFEMNVFRKALGFERENFHFMVFGKKHPVAEKYQLDLFDGNNLGWNGVFKTNSKERIFQETEYDVIINYFTQPSPELLIFSASAKANLKVGFPLAEKRLNDLEMAVDPNNPPLFASELKKYLAAIQK